MPFISHAIYNLFFSPLRKVPGPFLARFSRFWELNAIRTTDLNETYIRLHEKYGQKALSRILNPLSADWRLTCIRTCRTHCAEPL